MPFHILSDSVVMLPFDGYVLYIFSYVVTTADKKGGTMHIVTEMNIYHCQMEEHITRDKVPFHRNLITINVYVLSNFYIIRH